MIFGLVILSLFLYIVTFFEYLCYNHRCLALVAQVDRVFPSEGKDRWFESSQGHHREIRSNLFIVSRINRQSILN